MMIPSQGVQCKIVLVVISIAPAFSQVQYRGSTFRPFVRPSVHNLRRV